jgi:hypothetical protein
MIILSVYEKRFSAPLIIVKRFSLASIAIEV